MKSFKKSKLGLKENKPNKKNIGLFALKSKKIKLCQRKNSKKSKIKQNKFMKKTKNGAILFKSIVTNRKSEFDYF